MLNRCAQKEFFLLVFFFGGFRLNESILQGSGGYITRIKMLLAGFLVSVLLAVLVETCFVFRMRDFFPIDFPEMYARLKAVEKLSGSIFCPFIKQLLVVTQIIITAKHSRYSFLFIFIDENIYRVKFYQFRRKTNYGLFYTSIDIPKIKGRHCNLQEMQPKCWFSLLQSLIDPGI